MLCLCVCPVPRLGRAFKDSAKVREDRYGQPRVRDSTQQVRPRAALLAAAGEGSTLGCPRGMWMGTTPGLWLFLPHSTMTDRWRLTIRKYGKKPFP